MKKIVFLIVVCLASTGFSQIDIQIQTAQLEPVPGARVLAKSLLDRTTRFQWTSDRNGRVKLPFSEDTFYISVHAFGHDHYYDTISFTISKTITLTQALEFQDVVITGQSKATSLNNAVQKITIITAEQIQQSGAVNLADILTYQTGIRISQDNILGSSMDLNGLSGQNVKILLDGVPVIGRQNGNIDLCQINLNTVERIEVVEGPLSVLYGTDALAGTINIITKTKTPNGLQLEINPYYETIGNYNLTGAISYRKNRHKLSLDGGRNYFDGWSASDPYIQFPRETLADTNRVKTWKPKEQYFGGFRYAYFQEKGNVSLSGSHFNEMILNRGKPLSPYFEIAFDDTYLTKRSNFGLDANYSYKKTKWNTIVAFNDYNRIKNTYINDLTTLHTVLSATTGAQDTSRFNQITARASQNGRITKKLIYQLGVDFNHSNGWGERIENGRQSIGDYAVYLTADWRILDSLTIKPGLRYAYNTVFDSPLIPSLNFLYKLKKISVRGSVAKGFRAPDLKELYMEFVDVNHNILGNANLKAEDSWNYALFANYMRITRNKATAQMEYGVFYNEINNLITLGIVENNSYAYINIGEYSTVGQKLSFTYRHSRYGININASYIGRSNPDAKAFNQNTYSYSPELGSQVTYQVWKERLTATIFYKFNGQLQSFYVNSDEQIAATNQAAYHILDASITAKLLKNKSLTLTLGVKNLFNVTQVSVIGQSQGIHSSTSNFNAGRGISGFLSMRYAFQIKKNEK